MADLCLIENLKNESLNNMVDHDIIKIINNDSNQSPNLNGRKKRSRKIYANNNKNTITILRKKRFYDFQDKLYKLVIKKKVLIQSSLDKIRSKKTIYTIQDKNNISFIQTIKDFDPQNGQKIYEEIRGGAKAE